MAGGLYITPNGSGLSGNWNISGNAASVTSNCALGQKAAETRIAVETYILRPEGLPHFLNDHAGWKTA